MWTMQYRDLKQGIYVLVIMQENDSALTLQIAYDLPKFSF